MIDKLGVKWVEIDLDALSRNLKLIGRRVSPAGVIAVVKADAYGHGAVEVARAAEAAGVRTFAVSCLEEAVELRRQFFKREILIFGAPPRSQICDLLNYGLTPTVVSLDFARALSQEAIRLKKHSDVHVCVDTGDGRVGPSHAVAPSFIRSVASLRNLNLTGVYSHFSTADDDPAFAREQMRRFEAVLHELSRLGVSVPVRHLANSAGILNIPRSAFDCVRPGLLMYGITPGPPRKGALGVAPCFSLRTKVSFVKRVEAGFGVSYGRRYVTKRPTDIVTLPVGYADGFPRKFSNAGEVLIRGRRLPVAGAVCMDMVMVDAGPKSGIKPGDEAVLVGRQGREEITVYDLAKRLETIPYEVVCNLGRRLTRVYIKNKRVASVRRMITEF